MGRMTIAAVALLLATTPVQAEETISQRMADCAGLMQAAADWALHEADSARMQAASDRWLAASAMQARDEGAHYPDFLAVSMQADAVSHWHAAGADADGSEAFGAEAQACLALDRD